MSQRTRNKTLAAWLAAVGGSLGLHRFYLRGLGDWVGWLYPIPTALGLWGMQRMETLGQDDKLSWILTPLLGLSIAAACLSAIVYALADREKWNLKYNPEQDPQLAAGGTNWLTIGALAVALLGGAVALMSSIALSFQRYYEHEVEVSRQLSQTPD
ncbi:hypothetical protein [Hydrogenophaga sp. 5NK40-0174]|uniref:hypothetical protein n=1 Tax=Hydrogenophaga sp. 5NK40-0174 TaxID=3127649 RepID=UPI003105ED32